MTVSKVFHKGIMNILVLLATALKTHAVYLPVEIDGLVISEFSVLRDHLSRLKYKMVDSKTARLHFTQEITQHRCATHMALCGVVAAECENPHPSLFYDEKVDWIEKKCVNKCTTS